MIEITVYTVWTIEDSDYVEIFLKEDKAEERYKQYGEFGKWEQETFYVPLKVNLD
jgi:hypothetical protein